MKCNLFALLQSVISSTMIRQKNAHLAGGRFSCAQFSGGVRRCYLQLAPGTQTGRGDGLEAVDLVCLIAGASCGGTAGTAALARRGCRSTGCRFLRSLDGGARASARSLSSFHLPSVAFASRCGQSSTRCCRTTSSEQVGSVPKQARVARGKHHVVRRARSRTGRTSPRRILVVDGAGQADGVEVVLNLGSEIFDPVVDDEELKDRCRCASFLEQALCLFGIVGVDVEAS